MSSYTIQNIVASIILNQKMPLAKIKKLPNAKYNPEQFPGLVMKYPDLKMTFLIFGSGKLVCAGGKTKEDIENAISRLKKDLQKIKIDIGRDYKVEIQNIVATSDLGRPVDLNRMAYELDNTQYNPEQFPGLVYSLELDEKRKITFLIFGGGKIVCVGAREEPDVKEAIDRLTEILKEKNL